MIHEILPGDTLHVEWVSSGSSPTAGTYEVLNGDETVINTGSMVDSGSGLWYQDYTVPNTEAYYVFKTNFTIAAKPYKRSKRFRVIELETD